MSRRLLILSRRTTPEEPASDPLETRWATEDDAAAFARDIGTYPEAAFRERLTEDVRCYLALEGEHILHSSWCSTTATWTEELQTYLAPPEGDVYVYESFTVEAERGRGIYPKVLGAISSAVHREGVARVWIGVEPANEASIRAIKKAGFEEAYAITSEVHGAPTVHSERPLGGRDSLQIVAEPPRDDPSGG